MLWVAIASQLAAPFPIHIDRWFVADDFPSDMMEGLQTTFQPVTQTLVDATGKIVGCRVETPSSSPKMDALACAVILKRGRFEPARWGDGAAVPGVYRRPVTYKVFGDSHDRFSDIELQVAKLPDNEKATFVTVAFASDPNGKIGECLGARSATRSKPDNPALVAIACQAVQSDWKPFTVLDADGKQSRSVQNAIVKFTSDAKR